MNHERILKVADVIEANPDHFNMLYFAIAPGFGGRLGPEHTHLLLDVDLYECGTTACIAGWTTWLWGADVNPDRPIDDNAAEILGLSIDDADALFDNWDLDSAEIAAAHLREMVRADLDDAA